MSTPGGYGQQGPQYQQPGGYPQAGVPEQGPNMKVYWAITVVAVLGLAVAGYFFGRSQGERQYDPGTAGYQRIYQAGYEQGRTGGEASGAAAGKKEGEAAGTKAGLEQGKAQGTAQGTQEGATAALGGFTQWDTDGTFYVVTAGDGSQDEVPTVITSRVPMSADTYYSPCESDPSTLCTFPRPPAGGGSGGASAQAGDDTTDTTSGDDVSGRDGGAGN